MDCIQTKFSANKRHLHQWNISFLPAPLLQLPTGSPEMLLLGDKGPLWCEEQTWGVCSSSWWKIHHCISRKIHLNPAWGHLLIQVVRGQVSEVGAGLCPTVNSPAWGSCGGWWELQLLTLECVQVNKQCLLLLAMVAAYLLGQMSKIAMLTMGSCIHFIARSSLSLCHSCNLGEGPHWTAAPWWWLPKTWRWPCLVSIYFSTFLSCLDVEKSHHRHRKARGSSEEERKHVE